MEVVYNAMDDMRAMRESFRTDDISRLERRKIGAYRESYQSELMVLLPEHDVEALIERVKPLNQRESMKIIDISPLFHHDWLFSR